MSTPTPHDALTRALLEDPADVAELFQEALPAAIAQAILREARRRPLDLKVSTCRWFCGSPA